MSDDAQTGLSTIFQSAVPPSKLEPTEKLALTHIGKLEGRHGAAPCSAV